MNVTKNKVLYNFSDNSKPIASVTKFDNGVYTNSIYGANDNIGMTITLTANSFASTSTYLATDKIQIYKNML